MDTLNHLTQTDMFKTYIYNIYGTYLGFYEITGVGRVVGFRKHYDGMILIFDRVTYFHPELERQQTVYCAGIYFKIRSDVSYAENARLIMKEHRLKAAPSLKFESNTVNVTPRVYEHHCNRQFTDKRRCLKSLFRTITPCQTDRVIWNGEDCFICHDNGHTSNYGIHILEERCI